MPKGDDGNMITTIDEGHLWVFFASDTPDTRLAIGRPTGRKRPVIIMQQDKRPWITVASFNSQVAALAAIEFFTQLALQINRAVDGLEKEYDEKYIRLTNELENKHNPHQEKPDNDNPA